MKAATSEFGTLRTSENVRFLVVIGRKADFAWTGKNRRK